jgi:hypothetical protein
VVEPKEERLARIRYSLLECSAKNDVTSINHPSRIARSSRTGLVADGGGYNNRTQSQSGVKRGAAKKSCC